MVDYSLDFYTKSFILTLAIKVDFSSFPFGYRNRNENGSEKVVT